jgi:hypothetical protein
MAIHLNKNLPIEGVLLDSGATDIIFPTSKELSNFKSAKGNLLLADKVTQLPIEGIGDFGILKGVLVCSSLPFPILSISKLTEFGLIVFFNYGRAFIMAKIEEQWNYNIIATATRKTDDLYYIDNINQFKNIVSKSSNINVITLSSTHSGLNPLEWLHVRLAHVNERLLKHIVKNNIVLGLGVKWDEIKNIKLKLCDACQRGKMKAFPVPASISNKVYGIFEFISVDIVYFNEPSIKNYLFSALYVDKATSKVFQYAMKNKSDLLDSLKSLIREYEIQGH